MHLFTKILVALSATSLITCSAPAADHPYQLISDPANSLGFFLIHPGGTALKIDSAGWGPNWTWVPVIAHEPKIGTELDTSTPITISAPRDEIVDLHLHAQTAGEKTIVMQYAPRATKDIPLTMIAATIGVTEGNAASATLNLADGTHALVQLPAATSWYSKVKSISLAGKGWGPVNLSLDPPLEVGVDGVLRLAFATDLLKAGDNKATLTWTFPTAAPLVVKPEEVAKYSPEVVTPDWFAYQPKWNFADSPISMTQWREPAGSHGAVLQVGDHFQLADGTPIKFWGTNLSYGMSAPVKADADFTAARFAKFGVNAVRMHKFTGAGWEGIGDENDSTKMTAGGLDQLDYFANQLRTKGVYYGWSHTYHFKVRPANKSRIVGYDEIAKNGGDTYGLINWAEDVQDLMIEQVVNLLNHKNPYTNSTYAADPALCFVELQNEDDIFFFTSTDAYNKFPTYKKLLQKRFAEFLTEKYGTQDKLAAAWGRLNAGESLANATIEIQPNPWFSGDQNLPTQSGGARQRLLDNAAFLHQTQNRFYAKFAKAIRDTGYKGPLIGSPWQAPTMLPHYLNLRSDALVGAIDRHDYFGGTLTDTMLKSPGGGFLSAGLQQVSTLPFSLSEWIDVYPSLYSSEGPVIAAVYGMGLQGWDASYQFQSTSIHPADSVGNLPWGIWNADAPTQIGQYPILARMIQRGDVTESPVIATRRVSASDLASGTFNFSDSMQQKGDIKTFASPELLAAGRAVVEFTEQSAPSTLPGLAAYKQGSTITSATKQLAWDAGAGIITINTPGTQGFVGFAQHKTLPLADLSITSHAPYASLLITAREKTETIATAKTLLVCVIARNANAGFRVLTLDNKTIVDNGHGPIMLEPVGAEVTFNRRRIKEVHILDHDGLLTGRNAVSTANKLTIDGKADKAIYYEVVLE